MPALSPLIFSLRPKRVTSCVASRLTSRVTSRVTSNENRGSNGPDAGRRPERADETGYHIRCGVHGRDYVLQRAEISAAQAHQDPRCGYVYAAQRHEAL